MRTKDLEMSYEYCRKIVMKEAKNFYFGFILLPKSKRLAMYAVYAFMRICDDRVDQASSQAEARENLSDWRDETEKALRGQKTEHAVLQALVDTLASFKIPKKYIWELMDGVAMDLGKNTFQSFDDLYLYCYRVASTVGIVCLYIFGFDRPEALQAAENCGIAFQLTNILRDLKEDYLAGRVYLPQSELTAFKVNMNDIRSGCVSPAWDECIRFQISRALDFFQKGANVIDFIHPDSRRAFSALFDIYHRLLKKINCKRERLFQERIRLSFLEKSIITLKCLIFR